MTGQPGHGVGHSHDGMDWAARLDELRESDALLEPEMRALVGRLLRPADLSVVDVGCGAGGAAAAFARELADRRGSVTLVDSSPELLEAATRHVRDSAGPSVRVDGIRADAGSAELADQVAATDVVFASGAVHHLPDQLVGLRRLGRLLRPGGRLALVEDGLPVRHLPWDVGTGEPGLEERLSAALAEWFREMRESMPGAVRMPFGWSRALAHAGLSEVESFSYLVDRPAPCTAPVRAAALRRLRRLRDHADGRVDPADMRAVEQLLDPDSPQYVGHRDDVFLLAAYSVHVGTAPTG